MSAEHPNIKNFKSALRNGTIDDEKIRNFEKWMGNPKKFPEELRPEAEALLAEARNCKKSAPAPRQVPDNSSGAPRSNGFSGRRNQQDKVSNNRALSPADVIPNPFHNPYTFIPFPTQGAERHAPTPLTADEIETDRMTGVIDLELKTLSPLLSPEQKKQPRGTVVKSSPALRSGNHVIVPASSIRGMLRSLCAIVSCSALDYVDENLWLCQGRDTNLTVDDSGKRCDLFLGEVTKPGDIVHSGKIKIGKAFLVPTEKLKLQSRNEFADGTKQMWIDDPRGREINCSSVCDSRHPYRVKVSGRKVNKQARQNEGAFIPAEAVEIEIPARLWGEYQGRNRHGIRPGLKKGDLVWVEAVDPSQGIRRSEDIRSLQWARWGKTGVNFARQLPPHMVPDYMRGDGLVDITSDLFGSIPMDGSSYAAFAGRIRPENLVFANAQTVWNQLPPLSSPHPGCIAFYVGSGDYDRISIDDLPRGYKVYRTSKDHGDNAPWKYDVQPEFNQRKPRNFAESKIAKKVELVKEGATGSLRIAYRALNKKELSLLLLLLSCDLRIGGGKPLGLGHCKVTHITLRDELGEELISYQVEAATLPEGYEVPEEYLSRARLYNKTQEPVSMMRYPRAVDGNQRGGMCWFSRYASPRKIGGGLQPVWLDRNLAAAHGGNNQVRAQGLPEFDPHDPEADWLFGYDIECLRNEKYVTEFADGSTGSGSGTRYENDSQNRQTRQAWRDKR